MSQKPDYRETNGIPICPFCQKPTKRTGGGGTSTLVYYPPQYNEAGVNTNPDRNTCTYHWQCLECSKPFKTSGNYVDGFDYVL